MRSSQKSLVIKIFAVGHQKIVDFPALAKNDKQLSFLQKSGAFLPQFNLKTSLRVFREGLFRGKIGGQTGD